MDSEKKAVLESGELHEAAQKRPYEAPRLRHLGSVRVLTLGGTGGRGDSRSASGARPSSRDFKHDIQYVNEAERARLANDVLGLRLATYEYNQELGEPAGRTLGFIIEDAPSASFVRPDEKVVDLYAFASALAAVVQEQQASIKRLEAELAALRAGR